jgi:hypothetical protein
MVVRVRVRISWGGKTRNVVVLVNGGAESEEPVVVLRPEDVEELGSPLDSFDVIEVELAVGKTQSFISRDRVTVEFLD